MDLFIYFLISFIQPVILPTPEALAIVAASQKFGSFTAFVVGYIGIILGAIFIYFVAYYGFSRILYRFVNEKKLEDFRNSKASTNKFLLFGLFLFPVLPDDIICISSGTIKLDFRTFVSVLLISKFFTTLIYAYFFDVYNTIDKVYFIVGLILVVVLYFLFRRKLK